jgi:hypothetical protein
MCNFMHAVSQRYENLHEPSITFTYNTMTGPEVSQEAVTAMATRWPYHLVDSTTSPANLELEGDVAFDEWNITFRLTATQLSELRSGVLALTLYSDEDNLITAPWISTQDAVVAVVSAAINNAHADTPAIRRTSSFFNVRVLIYSYEASALISLLFFFSLVSEGTPLSA